MINNKIITEAIEYILLHIWEGVTLEQVAEHCHMSVSHISRVFKVQTGESVYAFIKRVKMEQSALKLKMEADRDITQIGADYGYSSSNYSSAFSQYHKMSPSTFRNEVVNNSKDVEAIIKEINSKIRIEMKPDFLVMFERSIGNYEDMKVEWCQFVKRYQEDINVDTIFFERCFDDPTITNKDNCIYDICMTTDMPEKYPNTSVLKGGRFLVYPYKGKIDGIYKINQQLIGIWFPSSHYEIDERYCYDQYYKVGDDGYMEFDICIPIR